MTRRLMGRRDVLFAHGSGVHVEARDAMISGQPYSGREWGRGPSPASKLVR